MNDPGWEFDDELPVQVATIDHPALALGIAVCVLPAFALGVIATIICERVF